MRTRFEISAGVAFTVVCLLLLAPFVGTAAEKKPGTATTQSAKGKSSTRSAISKDPYIGAIVVDATSGKVLFEDKADLKGYPASMLKLMDMLIVLEKLQQGQLSLQDQVVTSAKASGVGGSQVWLAEHESFTLEEMLYALMVHSANDVAVAISEKVAGSTEGFVQLMNQKAKQLGMNSTMFNSVHGLPPSAGQQYDVTTARDFAILCRELVLKHPEVLTYTSTRTRPFRPGVPNKTVVMQNHNHLVGTLDGCDGLKTGYIYAGGFCIAVTAQRDSRRVIAVVLGSVDRKVRDKKASELVAKGFAALPPAADATARTTTQAAPPQKSAPKK
jgi:serine-type D-Ala-D-Ala carboxypeptidase (penicillin-binding protein 5/6)